MTQCSRQRLLFEAHGTREVTAAFDGGRIGEVLPRLLLLPAAVHVLRSLAAGGRAASLEHRRQRRHDPGTAAACSPAPAPWPNVRIELRGDSGFCREPIMCWCEEHGVDYVLGLAKNKRLGRILGKDGTRRRSSSHRPARRPHEAETLLDLPQQQVPAIGGDAATVKGGRDFSSAVSLKKR